MTSFAIVPDFDVLEQITTGRLTRFPAGIVREFGLESGEKALGDGVVPAVSPPAHAAGDAMLDEIGLISITRVLGGASSRSWVFAA